MSKYKQLTLPVDRKKSSNAAFMLEKSINISHCPKERLKMIFSEDISP